MQMQMFYSTNPILQLSKILSPPSCGHSGEMAKQTFNSWGTAVRLAWDCPRYTRTFLVQQVLCCGHTSARADIMSRYCKYLRSLQHSASWEVRVLANYVGTDIRTVTAKNTRELELASKLDVAMTTPSQMKKAITDLKLVPVSPQDSWKPQYLSSLLTQRLMARIKVDDELETNLTGLIDSLVI